MLIAIVFTLLSVALIYGFPIVVFVSGVLMALGSFSTRSNAPVATTTLILGLFTIAAYVAAIIAALVYTIGLWVALL